ncbi:hypothetical protein PFICI_11181 [Pestalotiopsis fici W106-1]|uniref:Zn(2)-C6 fungal-type domain-containing protein n=1 Tax=Pestalotiopsis fici (strain W106-1 / CGMCC3.15140) TaxID=1229662 RepID=W3WW23_PESFW|nr:uncharacterized protein PFICI_11181 [Pestalotiopsis fici W106-1]ETS77307.1 hypothetical protein PFICI_11181 [Pestalotiopsis fici W106-1]
MDTTPEVRSSSSSTEASRAAERRVARANRACITCRARKQRCIPPAVNARPQAPCQRCMRHAITCSFETDRPPTVPEDIGPSQLSHIVIELQRRINTHEARIAELEKGSLYTRTQSSHERSLGHVEASSASERDSKNTEEPVSGIKDPAAPSVQSDRTTEPQASRYDINSLELVSPIATLRSLGALDSDQENAFSPFDPISCRLLSFQEAQDALHTYIDHCHPWAPVLDTGLRYSGMSLRQSSPALFLAIVAVGTRFWHGGSVHPRYFEIIDLLDKTISRLLLSPTPSDASVATIQALMIYLQWMPCVRKDNLSSTPSEHGLSQQQRTEIKTRYNDMSAWAVFGLALRYASFINLERLALAPFRGAAKVAVTKDDIARMRTWLNLITYDSSLTLTSGLPSSVDPLPAARVVQDFYLHRTAQDPGDVRYGALIELTCMVQRLKATDVGSSGRPPSVAILKKVNIEMEEWERHWLPKLRHTPLQHIQMPFTSLRWYRLSLNSSLLRPVLSSSTRSQTDILHVWTLGFLETSTTAASQILLSLATGASSFVWHVSSQNLTTYPADEFSIDPAARASLHHAVDATWISSTFALTFLVLCYIRRTIDDDLHILSIPTAESSASRAPAKPRSHSLLARLTKFAIEIFECESKGPEFRSGGGYEAVIRDAASIVLDDESSSQAAPIAQDTLDPAIQSLFDLMDDTVYEWPSVYEDDFMQPSSNFADSWGPR